MGRKAPQKSPNAKIMESSRGISPKTAGTVKKPPPPPPPPPKKS